LHEFQLARAHTEIVAPKLLDIRDVVDFLSHVQTVEIGRCANWSRVVGKVSMPAPATEKGR
jgi:hypothetical protein